MELYCSQIKIMFSKMEIKLNSPYHNFKCYNVLPTIVFIRIVQVTVQIFLYEIFCILVRKFIAFRNFTFC